MKKNYRTTTLLMFLLIAFCIPAKATIFPFHNTLTGTQEVPPNASTGKGAIAGWYNDETNTISYTIIFGGLSANVVAGHFHAPAPPGVNAPVIIAYAGFPTGVTLGSYSNSNVLTDAQETQLFAGLMYSNIHTSAFPGGEIRGQIVLGNPATMYVINNVYSGSQEVPPNASTATGRIIGSFNTTTHTISYAVIFSGLTTPATAAHFHAPGAAGVIAPVIISFTGFPNATTGTYFNSNVLTATQETWLLSNLFYANIHNPTFPGGEIRAQIIPNIPPTISCPANIVVSNTPGQCSRSVSFAATATGNPAPAVTYKIGTTTISSPYTFPVGTTTVTATATNTAGTASCTFTVTVNDTEAPVIHNLSASPDNIWPPNHKMKDVAVNYTTTDNCPGPISCSLSVTSNEAVNGTGDGNTSPDWVVIDDHNVQVRAERNGNGEGRIYTITTTCHDQYGNTSAKTTTVTVDHDKGKSNKRTESSIKDETAVTGITGLSVRVFNNPSRDHFTLNIQTNSLDKMTLRLIDIYGRVVESKFNLSGSQVVQVGSNLKAGSYYIQLEQGTQKTQLKLEKIR